MRKYKVKFLTQSGLVDMEISEGQDLDKLAEEIQAKYGMFTILSSTPIL